MEVSKKSSSLPHTHAHLPTWAAWNNYEGFDSSYTQNIGDVLGQQDYAVHMQGKTDWTAGGHAVWNWWQCFTMCVLLVLLLVRNDSMPTEL